MVLREQCIDRLEIEGIAIMDSWKTYDFLNHQFVSYPNTLLILQLGRGKVPFCMLYFLFVCPCYSWRLLDRQLFRTSGACMQPD